MTYYFYSKSDPKEEAIFKVSATNITEAINYFNKMKNLSTVDFLELYNVKGTNEDITE